MNIQKEGPTAVEPLSALLRAAPAGPVWPCMLLLPLLVNGLLLPLLANGSARTLPLRSCCHRCLHHRP